MTGEKYDSEDVRTQINNIKRADYRKNWKVEDRKKKKASAIVSEDATVSKVSPVPTKTALKEYPSENIQQYSNEANKSPPKQQENLQCHAVQE